MNFTRPNTLYFPSVTSTNDVLRQLAQNGAPTGTAVMAGAQTAGRGRLGRTFQSPEGSGLYLSVLYRPDKQQLLTLTALAAAAICQTVEKLTGLDVGIKWPNDLVVGGRKLGGILTEGAMNADGTVDHVLLGIGLNVHHTAADFAGDVADMAVSLHMLGADVSRKALAEALLRQLCPLPDIKAALSDYRRRCVTLGKTIHIVNTDKDAFAVDVDEQLGLTVRYGDGSVETLRCGEVSVRGLYGYSQ